MASAPVAFSAYPSITIDYDAGSIVQFDTIVTNIGNSYNPSFSVFQCPFDGIYLFSLSLETNIGPDMHAGIIKDGLHLLSSRSDDINNIQSSVVVVAECLENETVWVECIDDNQQLQGGKLSSFSGVLITPYA